MTTNRLAKSEALERSPLDPQECCDWANARMHPDRVGKMRWVVDSFGPNKIRLEYLA